jgi:type I restriction enzyme S subunit
MPEDKKKPAIRFVRFDDAWEQRKIDKLLTEVIRPVKMMDDKEYELVTVKRRNEGVTSRGKLKGIDILVKTYFEVKAGDYLISKRQVVHGANGIVPKNLDGAVVSNEYLVLTDNDGMSVEFLAILSKHPEMYKKFFLSSYGIDIEKLVFDVDDWKKRTINIPTIAEQKKICLFFKTIETLITLHQHKYDKLVSVKRSMLDKMFPKNGSNIPEIRFAGFTDPWEQRKLSDVAEFNPKGTLPDEFEYVDLESVVGTELISHRRETIHTAPSRAQRVAKYGDIFYQTVRPYQKNNYLFNSKENDYVFSTGYAQLRPQIKGSLLFCILQEDGFVKDVLDRCTGTSYPAITSTSLEDIAIKIPVNPVEQEKIGSFFKHMDNLITLHQRKLEKLKNVKKAMLDKMFL